MKDQIDYTSLCVFLLGIYGEKETNKIICRIEKTLTSYDKKQRESLPMKERFQKACQRWDQMVV